MKRTKIVCTIGPASASRSTLRAMVRAGMNIARLAFSHGSYESHLILLQTIREVSQSLHTPIAIMQDLQGPRIRIGDLPDAGIPVKRNERVALVVEMYFKQHRKTSDVKLIPIQFPELYLSVKKNNHILISDGLIDLSVTGVRDKMIFCKVKRSGVIHHHKGINLPGVSVQGSVITRKDKRDLAFGIAQKVDFVALSFVKDKHDIMELRCILSRLEERKTPMTKIIAKIERQEAVDHFDEIVCASDGIMIARGDLGIEIDPSDVPILQKQMIQKCIAASKPVIVATQMMESMIQSPRPTRAEVSDVANAVIDHTDATMLSGETSVGAYPIQVVRIMSGVVQTTEKSSFDDFDFENFSYKEEAMREMSVLLCSLASKIYEHDINMIVVHAKDDKIARFLSSLRMERDVVVLASDTRLFLQLSLLWGVVPVLVGKKKKYSRVMVRTLLRKMKILKKHSKVLYIDEYTFDDTHLEPFQWL